MAEILNIPPAPVNFTGNPIRIGHTENHLDFRFKNKLRWGDEKSKKEYDNYVLNKDIF